MMAQHKHLLTRQRCCSEPNGADLVKYHQKYSQIKHSCPTVARIQAPGIVSAINAGLGQHEQSSQPHVFLI